MMKALFFLVVGLSTMAAAAPINCNQFWAGAANETPLPCELYTRTGFPKTVGGAEMRIYHYANGWNDETGQLELLGAVSEAIEQAVPVYAKYAAIPRMYFVFYNEISDTDYAVSDWQFSTSTEPCRIRLFFNIPNNRDLAKQIAAHEIFHCVQLHGLVPIVSEEQDGKLRSARWWVEGSANYFSSLIAPNGNGEFESLPRYRPTLPVYHQPDPYSTALFFYGISNAGFEPQSIATLLKGQPANSTFAAERAALSNNASLADAFHTFATNLVNKQVTGAYFKPLPQQPEVTAGPPFTVELDTDHVGLSVVPFTINRSMLHFPAGTNLTLSLGQDAAAGKVEVSMRKSGDKFFNKLESGGTTEIQVMCNDEKGVDYDFVYTSTQDSGEAVPFTLQMKSNGETQACKCEDSALPVDKCLLGNWTLNNASFGSWLHGIAPGFHTVMVQGTETFGVQKTHTASHIFKDFQTTLTILHDGAVTPWTVTKENGQIDYDVIQRKPGSMCLRRKSAHGTVEVSINGGSTSTTPLDSALEGVDPDRDLRMRYECKGNTLTVSSEPGAEVQVQWVYDKAK